MIELLHFICLLVYLMLKSLFMMFFCVQKACTFVNKSRTHLLLCLQHEK